MRAFWLDRLPIAEGTDLFAMPSPSGRNNSLFTLAAASGVTHRILENALEWFERLHPDDDLPSHSTVPEAAAAEEIAFMLRTSIPMSALPARFGCDDTTARLIIRSG